MPDTKVLSKFQLYVAMQDIITLLLFTNGPICPCEIITLTFRARYFQKFVNAFNFTADKTSQ